MRRSVLGLFLSLALAGEASASISNSSSSRSSCSGCDIEDWNDENFAQCNFWGDPHITSSYGDLGSFDFQGLGLWKASVSSACGYKFQVNAFTCRYTPQLWSNSITRYLAIQIGDKIIYVNNTNVGGSGLDMVDDPSFSLQTAGINIQSPDKCFRMNVNVKPLDGGSRWYHNVKLRVIKHAVEKDGICGASDLRDQLVYYDDADVLFTEEQLAEMCSACTEPNAPAPLGCPGSATSSPGCEFMSQSTNLNSFECTKDMLPQDGDAPDADNLTKYLELTNDGEYCMAYVKTKGPGASRDCNQYCEDIGSKCVAVWDQIARTSCTLDPVDIFEKHGATCDHRAKLSDMLCICDKPSPEDPFPGPPPKRVCGDPDSDSFNEAKDLCKVCLPNAEYTETPVTEQDQRLRSCIVDICSLPDTATLDDKKAISENACEQDPILPPSGRKLCSSGGFCESICGDELVFPSIGASACQSLCKPLFESKVAPGLRGFCGFKDSCQGQECSDSSYYCPLLCQSLECDQNVQDGCSGCQQRCATAFGDVDDILEEYCEDCYSVPVDDSDPCKRSGFCAEYCKGAVNGNDPLVFKKPSDCLDVCNSDAGYDRIISTVESKFCPNDISRKDANGICKGDLCKIGGKRRACFGPCANALLDSTGFVVQFATSASLALDVETTVVRMHSLMEVNEDVGLLQSRSYALQPDVPDVESSELSAGSKSFYCKRLCDDGLKTKGNREPACIQGCLQKFSQVVSVLEIYEEKCPNCKAIVRGDDDRR
ncbi:unnamed protein product, partial [Symbiodinium sp. KB8]